MALTPQQISELNAASLKTNKTANDIANLNYATKTFGYKATTPTATPQQATASMIDPKTGQPIRKVVNVGDPNAFAGGYALEDRITDPNKQYGTTYSIGGVNYGINPTKPVMTDKVNSELLNNEKQIGIGTPPEGAVDTSPFVAGLDPGIKGFESLIQQSLTPPPSEAKVDPLVQKVSDLVGQTYQKPADFQIELDKYGFGTNVADLQNLNVQMASAKAQYDKLQEAIANKPIESRIIGGTQDRLMRQSAIELGGLSSMAQALQGNVQMAMNIAEKTTDIKYEPILRDIDHQKWQLDQVYQQMDREDQRKADAMKITLNERERLINEDKEKEMDISNIMMSAAENGADSATLQKIMKSGDIGSAIMAAGDFLNTKKQGQYDMFKGQDGIDYVFDPETGTVKPITQMGNPELPADGEYGGQCGDYLRKQMEGHPPLGNLYTEKQKVMNVSKDNYSPQVGDIMLFETLMPYGHVAAITSFDGQNITVTESNYKNNEIVGTRTFKLTDLQKMKFAGAYRGAQFKNMDSSNVDSTAQGWADLISQGKAEITNVPADKRNAVASLLSQMTTKGDDLTDTVAQEKADQALSLKEHKGFDSAVGVVATGRVAMPWNIGNKQDFIASVEQLVSGLSLDSLIEAKARGATFGALSDTEMRILASAATKIGTWRIQDKNGKVKGYKVGHTAMRKELDNINQILLRQVKGSTNIGTTGVTSSGISYKIE